MQKPNILIVGCGAVGQAVVRLLLDANIAKPEQITVLDFVDSRDCIRAALAAGVNWRFVRVHRDNYAAVLAQYLGAGDILLSIAWCVETRALLHWCRDHGVLYLNTAVEIWDHWSTYRQIGGGFDATDNLAMFYSQLKQECLSWQGNGPTAVLDFGANPGLVSLFAKRALLDMAAWSLAQPLETGRHKLISMSASAHAWPTLSQALGLRVLQISEIDNQSANLVRQPDQFISTWSIEGLLEEATAPAEFCPGDVWELAELGTSQAINHQQVTCVLHEPGMNVWTKSYSPEAGVFEGMVIRHAEILGISELLTDTDNQQALRPAVMFVYRPCEHTLESLLELKKRGRALNSGLVLNGHITKGADAMGVFLISDLGCWWTGSILDIQTANRLVPDQNATTVQVGAAAVAALAWLLENPQRGVCFPEQLPLTVLAKAMPYLGRFQSIPVGAVAELPAPLSIKLHHNPL